MLRRAASIVTSALGWAVHLAGVGLVLAGLVLLIAPIWLRIPERAVHAVYDRRNGVSHIRATVNNEGLLKVGVGEVRSNVRTGAGEYAGHYFAFGRTGSGWTGQLEAVHHRTSECLPDGRPVREYTTIYVRWQFICFVGLIVAAFPLLAGPSRRSIVRAYGWVASRLTVLLRPLLVFAPGGRRRPRGFEVIPRNGNNNPPAGA